MAQMGYYLVCIMMTSVRGLYSLVAWIRLMNYTYDVGHAMTNYLDSRLDSKATKVVWWWRQGLETFSGHLALCKGHRRLIFTLFGYDKAMLIERKMNEKLPYLWLYQFFTIERGLGHLCMISISGAYNSSIHYWDHYLCAIYSNQTNDALTTDRCKRWHWLRSHHPFRFCLANYQIHYIW